MGDGAPGIRAIVAIDLLHTQGMQTLTRQAW
jgi:hypothetical protein